LFDVLFGCGYLIWTLIQLGLDIDLFVLGLSKTEWSDIVADVSALLGSITNMLLIWVFWIFGNNSPIDGRAFWLVFAVNIIWQASSATLNIMFFVINYATLSMGVKQILDMTFDEVAALLIIINCVLVLLISIRLQSVNKHSHSIPDLFRICKIIGSFLIFWSLFQLVVDVFTQNKSLNIGVEILSDIILSFHAGTNLLMIYLLEVIANKADDVVMAGGTDGNYFLLEHQGKN